MSRIVCKVCKKRKNKTSFYWSGGHLRHGECKGCYKPIRKERYDRTYQKYRSKLLSTNARYKLLNREKVREWHREYKKRNREKIKAHEAVYYQVRVGNMIKPSICSRCGGNGIIHAHHFLGYSCKHKLDVVWLCHQCHTNEHKRQNPPSIENEK